MENTCLLQWLKHRICTGRDSGSTKYLIEIKICLILLMIFLPVVLGDDDVDTDAIFCLKILKNLTISANQIQLIIFVVICDIAVNTVITKT